MSKPSFWTGEIRRELRKNKPAPKENAALKETFNWLVSLTIDDKMPAIDMHLLREIHFQVVQGGGEFRTKGVRIGSYRSFPFHNKVHNLVAHHLANISNKKEIDLYDVASLHLELVSVHPFSDGNGRSARLLCTALLLKLGYKSTLFTAVEQHYQFDPPRYGRILGSYRAGKIDKASVLKDFLESMVINTKYVTWFRLRNKVLAGNNAGSHTVNFSAKHDVDPLQSMTESQTSPGATINMFGKQQLYYQLNRVLTEEERSK